LPPLGVTAHASYPPAPGTLELLCESSPVVIIGKVVGVLRNAHSVRQNREGGQHTVFLVAVEEYLKTDNKGDKGPMPQVIKIWYEGGWLPRVSEDGEVISKGSQIQTNPLLQIGNRHLFFLKHSSEWESAKSEKSERSPRRDRYIEADEFVLASTVGGNILLGETVTRAYYAPNSDAARFLTGPQIIGVPEAQARAAVRKVLKRP
jgi:hypothetical protein